MAITTQNARVAYVGDGSTTGFTINFKFLLDADIRVVIINDSGTETSLVLNTDYTLTGAGTESGGTLTTMVAPLATETIAIWRYVTPTQTSDYVNAGRLSSQSIEDDFDKIWMKIQEMNEGIVGDSSGDGALNVTYPKTEATSTNTDLPIKTERISKLAGWDANGEWTSTDIPSLTGGNLVGPGTQVVDNLAIYDAVQGVLKQDNDIAKSLFKPQTLTNTATINWDSSVGHIATLTLGPTTPTLNVTNIKPGKYSLVVIQDGTGGRTITWGTGFSGTANVQLNTDASAITVLDFVSDGTNVYLTGGSGTAASVSGLVGTLHWFMYDIAGNEDDVGYLICNGQAVSRTKYADLFGKLSTSYGVGDGSTTFNVPDLTTGNRFIRASTTAGSLQADATAVNGLSDTGHSHTYTDHDNSTATTISYQTGATGPVNIDFLPGDLTTQGASANLTGDAETRPINMSAIPGIKF